MSDILDWDDDALFRLATEVSGWTVANQVYHVASATGHMLLAVELIARKKSPAVDGGTATTMGKMVLRAGRFPRGKGKAPRVSVPPDTFTREDLQGAVSRSRSRWEATPDVLEQASESTWTTKHPYFGDFGAEQWLRLAGIHADHHYRIIDDILKAG